MVEPTGRPTATGGSGQGRKRSSLSSNASCMLCKHMLGPLLERNCNMSGRFCSLKTGFCLDAFPSGPIARRSCPHLSGHEVGNTSYKQINRACTVTDTRRAFMMGYAMRAAQTDGARYYAKRMGLPIKHLVVAPRMPCGMKLAARM